MNVLIFGPNGSGKGAQSALLVRQYGFTHIEVGRLFRAQATRGTQLGLAASKYIQAGELVPDEITIPMVVEEIKGSGDARRLLDGFPRNISQAEALLSALLENKLTLDVVIELVLDRNIARDRILGRRTCEMSAIHPNNLNVEQLLPKDGKCRICGGQLHARADDQDESAINKRHEIYYDESVGTLAAVEFLKERTSAKYVSVGAEGSIEEIYDNISSRLD